MAAGRAAAGKWARAMPGGGWLAAGRPSTSTPPLTMAGHPATARRRSTGRSRPTATHRPRCDAWHDTNRVRIEPLDGALRSRATTPAGLAAAAGTRRRRRGQSDSSSHFPPPPASSTAASDVAVATATRRLWQRCAASAPALGKVPASAARPYAPSTDAAWPLPLPPPPPSPAHVGVV